MAKALKPQRLSVFAYTEGSDEKVFIEHLKDLYSPARRVYIPVYVANGKGPDYIVDKACRVRGLKSYFDHSFILMDTDIPWSVNATGKAKKSGFELIGNTPCIESLFLSLINPGTDHSLKKSNACKAEFSKKHIPHSNSLRPEDCARIFPKPLIDKALSRIPHLNRLVEILRGNY